MNPKPKAERQTKLEILRERKRRAAEGGGEARVAAHGLEPTFVSLAA